MKNCSCWRGYERVPGTRPCAPNSCRKKSNGEKRKASNFMEIQKSNKPGKKWKTKVGGKTYHGGDSNYTIAPGTKRGDAYCARSSGIKMTPKNRMARKKWRCRGKKSMK